MELYAESKVSRAIQKQESSLIHKLDIGHTLNKVRKDENKKLIFF